MVKVVEQVSAAIQKRMSDGFVRNLGWMGISQLIVRISRLAATVILPRFLSQYDYGLAALVLTTYEFTQVFTRIGISAKVIQAEDDRLDEISHSAYWLNWVVYTALFFLQCLAAFPIAWFYNDNQLIIPICALAVTYLIGPLGRVQASLVQRENRFKIVALNQTITLVAANILTALFAFWGLGMWAIVLPRILVAPIEFIVYCAYHPWRCRKGFTTKYWGEIFKFGSSILGINLLKTLRDNMDYLIVGRFLGLKELGVYYFAFNAGLGISLSIIQSIIVALYPHLCAVRSDFAKLKESYYKSLRTIGKIMVPFVLIQSVFAPFYVPVLFGKEWVVAVPVLILICLSAIPRPFDAAAFQLLASVDKPQIGLLWNVAFTLLFTLALMIGVYWQAIGVAAAVLIIHVLFVPVFLIWTNRYVFGPRSPFAT